MKKLSVTIGLPTYVLPENVLGILDAVVRQKCHNIVLKEILLFIDGNKKSTRDVLPNKLDKRIRLIRSSKRRGFSGAVFAMLEKTSSDVFVLLNDDVFITDAHLLEKMCAPFCEDERIGLVGGKPIPITAQNAIQEVGVTTFRVYDSFRYALNKGNSKYTCDGMLLALSRKFYTDLLQYSVRSDLGTLDCYLYFYCITRNFRFYHERTARLFYIYPTSIKEYVMRNIRNNSNNYLLRKRFGSIVNKELKKPLIAYIRAVLTVFLAYPIHTMVATALGIYFHSKEKQFSTHFPEAWRSLDSTKRLSG